MSESLKTGGEEFVNGDNEDGLKILTEMSGKFDADEARRLAEVGQPKEYDMSKIETQESAISEAAARIGAIFKQKKQNKNNEPVVDTVQEQNDSEPSALKPRTISDRYDAVERSRVDRLKSDLQYDFDKQNEYLERGVQAQPSTFKKAFRLMMDRLGMRTKKDDAQREKEAMHVALTEYLEENREGIAAEYDAYERRRQEEEREAIEKSQMEKIQIEKEAKRKLEEKIGDNMDDAKRMRFEAQRVQEIVERDINSRLSTVDYLETEVLSENPEIQKRSVRWRRHDIPVYDLKGIHFSTLSTTIDYRKGDRSEIGQKTYKAVMKNPWIWARRRDEVEGTKGFGTRQANAKGDTISASYWDTERNITAHASGELIYGFASVEADSILLIADRDLGTPNIVGERVETGLQKRHLDAIKKIESGSGRKEDYNEAFLRRYSENGVPKKPDYIIVEDGKITETVLRSAAYFGIPIVNVERSTYLERQEKRGEELLDSVIEGDDEYVDIDKKIVEIKSMSKFNARYDDLEDVGMYYNYKDRTMIKNPSVFGGRCLAAAQSEQMKRLGFIEETMEKGISILQSATETERSIDQGVEFPGFKYFGVRIVDVHEKLKYENGKESFFGIDSKPGACNYIEIEFQLEGSPRRVKTRIYEGRHFLRVDEARDLTQEDFDNADSSYYEKFEPIVRRYFEAFRENHEL